MTMSMMMPMGIQELEMQMGIGNPFNTEPEQEDQEELVPTTVSEQTADLEEDGGYGSEGFYQQTNIKSEETSPDMSGSSTPANSEENSMDLFANFAENWVELPSDVLPFQLQQYNTISQPGSQSAGVTAVDNSFMYKAGDNSYLSKMAADDSYTATANEENQSSDEDEVGDENLPEILRRSVKGMSAEDKKLRRRELNRLAAQRSRQKKRSTAVSFEQEATRLTKRNAELKVELTRLETAKTELYSLIKNHFKQCGTKNSNFNNNNNNNLNKYADVHHGAKHGDQPNHQPTAAPCSQVPVACVAEAPATAANNGGMYQYYASDVNSLSQGFGVAYD